mgnify:FL=1
MTKTCGQCIHLKDGSCMSLDSLVPLHDLVLSSDPACAVFSQRPAAQTPERIIHCPSASGLGILSQETLSNLAGDDPAVIQARAMAEKVTAENEARHARRRDWHRDIDR